MSSKYKISYPGQPNALDVQRVDDWLAATIRLKLKQYNITDVVITHRDLDDDRSVLDSIACSSVLVASLQQACAFMNIKVEFKELNPILRRNVYLVDSQQQHKIFNYIKALHALLAISNDHTTSLDVELPTPTLLRIFCNCPVLLKEITDHISKLPQAQVTELK